MSLDTLGKNDVFYISVVTNLGYSATLFAKQGHFIFG